MNISKVDKDTATIDLFKNKDNVNDTITYLSNTVAQSTTSSTTIPTVKNNALSTSSIEVVRNSGASGNFVRESDEPYVCNVHPSIGLPVTLPVATTVQSSQQKHLLHLYLLH